MKHTVKFWDKKLLSLQRLADSVGKEFCKMKYPRPEILPLFYKVVERVQSVRNCKGE